MADVRYAPTDDVLRALDLDPNTVQDSLKTRAKSRVASATQKWINRTNRPFHPKRVGDPSEPRTWEVYDVQDAVSWHPATISLDNANPLPIDPAQGDVIEVRTGRDEWENITDQEGEAFTLDYRRRRLRVFERRFTNTPWDDPNTRFCRLTYRHGPLGEDVTVTDDGLVEGVPADVVEAVAAKAATMLALDDDQMTSAPDSGQLTNRSTKEQALEETWQDTTASYSGFSTL
ncbi:hypothetical protein [Haloarcula amylolytica]|uniref:Uncharacterized protein n=1 Tax=Haloarcula amylolytica JCM 13557 TaxID=1227452 RepID=M0KBF9_9EURY|nr:hypothetical protein [Haloarcula amylolytica]EMA17185.1 hypothetical protein C442_17985 [Haloarcula amylolytica JCM 13557]